MGEALIYIACGILITGLILFLFCAIIVSKDK